MQAAGYDRPSRQALWNTCQHRLLSLTPAPERSHIEVLLADGFSTAMAALLESNPMIPLEHASQSPTGPADAMDQIWGYLPGGPATQRQIRNLGASMRMLVKGDSPAMISAKAFKVSD